MATLHVNGRVLRHDAEPDTPLLWVLREQLGLTGTKYGCGVAQCGACTVHIDGVPTRSCVRPVSSVEASERITTIEGLSPDGQHPLQKAWVKLDVPQCGFLRYGQVAADAAKLTPPTEVALKDPKTWTIAGKPLPRLDTVAKTTGAQVYGMDLQLPGMLNAAIRDCPVVGGKVKRFDATAIRQRPGVKAVVAVGDSAVAVVADTWWRAKTALDALTIEWEEGPHAKLSSVDIAATLKAGLDAPDALVGSQVGQAKEALAGAARTLDAYPYQNHATMEVMNATARFSPASGNQLARCEVWTPTQNGEAALAGASEAAGLPPAQCEVYKIHLGGGFGRRGSTDWVRQAVEIAKALPGTPVKLIWSREEDMQHGFYHPITQCKLRAGLDAKGQLSALHMRISGQSILAALLPQALQNGKDPVVFQGLNAGGAEGALGYAVPHLLIDHAMRNPPVRPGFWRGVNLNHNAIYLECFIDEIAHASAQDPLALRRQLLAASPKHLAVLNAVAERAGRHPTSTARRCTVGWRRSWVSAAMSRPAPRCP